VIVTGAARGIGKGTVAALAGRGASVLMVDINESGLRSAHDALSAGDGKLVAHCADISDPSTAGGVVAAAVAAFGHLDALVNNAIAGQEAKAFVDFTDDCYMTCFDTGPRGTFALMKAAYPHLKARGGGSIVNLGSQAGTNGMPYFAVYGGAKEAIRGLSKVAALEWGQDNIRVNVICPFGNSEGTDEWQANEPDSFNATMEKVPLRRIGDVRDDIGALISFLVGDDSTYITAQTIFVDGGLGTLR
jgi:NAD(P)-dependent dehydrogenase (short-subunit alcohol dehydrogenase family)